MSYSYKNPLPSWVNKVPPPEVTSPREKITNVLQAITTVLQAELEASGIPAHHVYISFPNTEHPSVKIALSLEAPLPIKAKMSEFIERRAGNPYDPTDNSFCGGPKAKRWSIRTAGGKYGLREITISTTSYLPLMLKDAVSNLILHPGPNQMSL